MHPLIRAIDGIMYRHPDSASDMKNAFCSPLPNVGTNGASLMDLPHVGENVRVPSASRESYTLWNSHSRIYVTSFGEKLFKKTGKTKVEAHLAHRAVQEDVWMSVPAAMEHMSKHFSNYTSRLQLY